MYHFITRQKYFSKSLEIYVHICYTINVERSYGLRARQWRPVGFAPAAATAWPSSTLGSLRSPSVKEMGRKQKRREQAMVKMAMLTTLLNLIAALVELATKLLDR